jgi:hypothetical protein
MLLMNWQFEIERLFSMPTRLSGSRNRAAGTTALRRVGLELHPRFVPIVFVSIPFNQATVPTC